MIPIDMHQPHQICYRKLSLMLKIRALFLVEIEHTCTKKKHKLKTNRYIPRSALNLKQQRHQTSKKIVGELKTSEMFVFMVV